MLKINQCTPLIFLLLASQILCAQQMPIDFSNSNEQFSSFSGSGFSFNIDPDDTKNDVGQFYNDGSNVWQGFSLDLIRSVDLDSKKTISLSFYGFDPNTHTVVLKLEKGGNADVEVTQTIPSGGGWTHDVTFDFANAKLSSDGVTPINASGKYDKIVLFVDGGVSTAGTYLIDNITDGSVKTDPNAIDVEYPYLVWEDNFNNPGAVDPEKWHHQTQVIIPGFGWANGEEQHYTNSIGNSFVDNDGYLNIVAKKESTTSQGLTKNYSSARLNSKFAFTYGRIDVRAKIPIEKGSFPAIWTLDKNINEDGGFWDSNFGSKSWPACGEIDIMEHGIFSNKDINFVGSALHTPCCQGGNPNKGGTIANNLGNDFHVYSVNWSPNQITFLLDGVGFYTYNPAVKDASTWPFTEDQYILLNVAMGGIAGPVESGFTQSSMVIDYVRVYQESPVSAVDEIILYPAISIYPNPTTSDLYINSESPITRLSISDIYGRQVLSKESDFGHLDISDFPSATYFIEIITGNQKIVKKIIVQ